MDPHNVSSISPGSRSPGTIQFGGSGSQLPGEAKASTGEALYTPRQRRFGLASIIVTVFFPFGSLQNHSGGCKELQQTRTCRLSSLPGPVDCRPRGPNQFPYIRIYLIVMDSMADFVRQKLQTMPGSSAVWARPPAPPPPSAS